MWPEKTPGDGDKKVSPDFLCQFPTLERLGLINRFIAFRTLLHFGLTRFEPNNIYNWLIF